MHAFVDRYHLPRNVPTISKTVVSFLLIFHGILEIPLGLIVWCNLATCLCYAGDIEIEMGMNEAINLFNQNVRTNKIIIKWVQKWSNVQY